MFNLKSSIFNLQSVMSQGSRPDRVADQLRSELALMLSREVHDPGVGFLTLTRVHVSPDLQQARVMYTVLGDDKARANTAKALSIASAVPASANTICTPTFCAASIIFFS